MNSSSSTSSSSIHIRDPDSKEEPLLPYSIQDDLAYLVCDVSSLTSWTSIKNEWFYRDGYQTDRMFMIIAALVFVICIVMVTAIVCSIGPWAVFMSIYGTGLVCFLLFVSYRIGYRMGHKSIK